MFIQMCCYKNIIIDNIQKYTERDFLEIHTLAAAEMRPLDTLFRYYLLLIEVWPTFYRCLKWVLFVLISSTIAAGGN